MPKGIIPTICGDEHDAFTRWRHYLHWRPGERAQIKRFYNKRVRRVFKRKLRAPKIQD